MNRTVLYVVVLLVAANSAECQLAGSSWPKAHADAGNSGYTPIVARAGEFQWDSGARWIKGVSVGQNGAIYHCNSVGLTATTSDGSLKWDWRLLGAGQGYPAIDKDGMIYFVSVRDRVGYLSALWPDGRRKWSVPLGQYQLGTESSPTIDSLGNILIGTMDQGVVYSFRASSGQKLWSIETGYWIDTTMAIGPDNSVYFANNNSEVVALTSDGKFKWKVDLGLGRNATGGVSVGSEGDVYCANAAGFGIGPDVGVLARINSAGTVMWSVSSGPGSIQPPTIGPDGTIYLLGIDGVLRAFDSSSHLLWECATGLDYGSALTVPVVDGAGVIYFVATDGLRSASYLVGVGPDGKERVRMDMLGRDPGPIAIGPQGQIYTGYASIVPEPGSLLTIATGVLGMAAVRRRASLHHA
ncbi:MAG: PQQ-binding-like beta-propeller repeat protein [Armatimonadota bacterium]